jgi:hypothetical protein
MREFLFIIGFYLLFTKFVLSSIQITLTANPTHACVGCSISFSVNSPCNLRDATFYWNFGDGQTKTTTTSFTSHTYTNPGNYTASVLVVKSNDSGSNSTNVYIRQLGSFKIDAIRVYDIEGHPLWFHIHVYQTELKDSYGYDWNSLSYRVRYEWWNCIDGRYYPSGYAAAYTFETIFYWTYINDVGCAVRGHVYCEKNSNVEMYSNTVTFIYINKVME